jgi:hypothetical protein
VLNSLVPRGRWDSLGMDGAEASALLANSAGSPPGTEPPIYPGADDPPIERDWGGSYFTNEYQTVTASDARALARALFRAIDTARTNQPITPEQATAFEDVDLRVLDDLACFSWNGSFVIG